MQELITLFLFAINMFFAALNFASGRLGWAFFSFAVALYVLFASNR